MKLVIVALLFISQFSMAARIQQAGWDANSQKVVVQLAFQGGCLSHQFQVNWSACSKDAVSNQVTRFGSIVDSGGADTCDQELTQTISAQEPFDGCIADVLVLKSTSSKTLVTVVK
jgi:hypothetical protein